MIQYALSLRTKMSLLSCSCSCSTDNTDSERKCEVFNCSKEDLIRSGLYFKNILRHVMCGACGWESEEINMPILHLNFLHSVQKPDCKMVKSIRKNCKQLANNITSVGSLEHLLKKTFLLWPKSYPDVDKFVRTGLYYSGIEDVVTCVSCGLSLEDWQPEDDPHDEHKKANPNCVLFI